MITLRDYQKEPIRKAIRYFRSDSDIPSLIVLPTAWGKSILTAYVAKYIKPEEKLLVVQPSKELLEQNYNKYINLCEGEETAGIYSASFGKKDVQRITYATIGSIKEMGSKFKELGFTKMLIDEAHLYPRKEESMLGKFLKDSEIKQVLGITATPLKLESFSEKQGDRFDKWSELIMLTNLSPSGTFFKQILHIGQIQEMIALHYWSPLIYERIPFDTSELRLNSTGSEFSKESTEQAYILNNIRNNIYGALDYHTERKHCVVFVPTVMEAQILAADYPNAAYICGETPKKERDKIIKAFRNGEIRVIFNVNVLSCLSNDTEILTRDGWKGINKISYNDNIAEYDNGQITFEKPTNIITKNYTGKMVTSENRIMNFRVTEDHDMIFTKKTTHNKLKSLNYCKASSFVNKKSIFIPINGFTKPEKFDIKRNILNCSDSRFIIQNSYNYRKKGLNPEMAKEQAKKLLIQRKKETPKNPDELSLDECRFIGFWLGDGSITENKNHKNGKRYKLSQSSRYPKMIAWLENLLKKCEINYSKHILCKEKNNEILGRLCHINEAYSYTLYMGTGGHNQNIKSNLHKLIPYLKKDGTELYWGLNRKQFFALMEGFWKANGIHGNNKKYTGKYICSSNKNLLDLLQAIGTCRGYRIIISEIKKRETNKIQLYSITLSDIHFHEFVNNTPHYTQADNESVWCVTVPKGTIITRRKGKVSIVCNCGFDYPEIDLLLLAFSTASVSKYYQICGRGVRIHPNKKDCLIIDMGGNIDRFGTVESIRFEQTDRWRMYGSNNTLLTGLPIDCLGVIQKEDIERASLNKKDDIRMTFGKHKGKRTDEVPMSYRKWYIKSTGNKDANLMDNFIYEIENHIKDTTNDPMDELMPDGQYAGVSIGLVPKGYLAWYYCSKKWNECNDSLRRAIEYHYGGIPKYVKYQKKPASANKKTR